MKYILSLFLIVSIYACSKNDKETYTVSGRFVDGTHPTNKFANLKLTFEDYHNHKKLVELGETLIDTNGNFKFTYEYSSTYTSNYLRIYVDSSFIASKKLYSLELGSNWNKIFYMSDSALLNLQIDTVLGNKDTLYFTNGDSVYAFLGPKPKGYQLNIKLINQSSSGMVGYCIGYNQLLMNQIRIFYIPTGEPIIDKIILF